MAARTLLFIISLVYFTEFTLAFSLQHVMARLNALEVKFDMLDLENKLRRSETEELFQRVSEISTSGKMITTSEHVSRDASSDYGEHVSPKEIVAPVDQTTILPHKDMNKTTESALELQEIESYLIEGAKNEKDKNLKLRTELKDIGNMLKADYAELESNIKEEMRNLTNNFSENQNSLQIDYTSFKTNIKDFVTTALSIASNESRQAIISLKSDFEMSISKISDNARTVSKTLTNIIIRQTDIDTSLEELSNSMNRTLSNIKDVRSEFQSFNQEFVHSLRTMNKFYANIENRRSCQHTPYSGVYDIYLDEKSVSSVRVYCDKTTDGEGWLVFQRRQNGSMDFERTWADYKTGFGNLEGEFWFGNDKLYALTSAGFNELRIDLEDFEGNRRYAKYSHFKLKPESKKYELEVRGYSGDAGDSLEYHNGMSFSTKDRDNDRSVNRCSINHRGAWWYNQCHHSNLNGFYYRGANSPNSKGVNWYDWKGWDYSLKRVEMKMRKHDIFI